MKIGVFDSGIGGLSFVNAIKQALPNDEILFVNDVEHVPYGTKTPDEILGYVVPKLQSLVDDGCSVIVVACNTVSTTLIDSLRQRFSVPLVAVEPMVKPAAAMTQTNVFAVCATPTTLNSPRYAELKRQYAADKRVVEPDCSTWSYMIETNQLDREKVRHEIEWALDQQADVIVLGCTHYHWIEAEINTIVDGRATVIQPEPAVIEQLKRVMATVVTS